MEIHHRSQGSRETNGHGEDGASPEIHEQPSTNQLPTYSRLHSSYDPPSDQPEARLTPKAAEARVLCDANSSLSTTSQAPYAQCGLRRSLQIPTKRSTITSGFPLPPKLACCGVSPQKWHAFQCEIREHGSISGGQWAKNIGLSLVIDGVSAAFVGIGLVVAIPVSYIYRSKRERINFLAAQASGSLQKCLDQWNWKYFNHLGLHATVEAPASGDMKGAEVASTKLFRYQQKKRIESECAGTATLTADRKELRYEEREGRQRVKAARKGRIVIAPLETMRHS